MQRQSFCTEDLSLGSHCHYKLLLTSARCSAAEDTSSNSQVYAENRNNSAAMDRGVEAKRAAQMPQHGHIVASRFGVGQGYLRCVRENTGSLEEQSLRVKNVTRVQKTRLLL